MKLSGLKKKKGGDFDVWLGGNLFCHEVGDVDFSRRKRLFFFCFTLFRERLKGFF